MPIEGGREREKSMIEKSKLREGGEKGERDGEGCKLAKTFDYCRPNQQIDHYKH